jgi:hypothetical protein
MLFALKTSATETLRFIIFILELNPQTQTYFCRYFVFFSEVDDIWHQLLLHCHVAYLLIR